MALSLTATDDADGTGATATVAGSSGGTVTVFAQPADRSAGWMSYGSRTGDGPVAIALAAGAWWVYAVEATTVAFAVGPVIVTDGTLALPGRVRAGIVARLQALGITEIGSNIYAQFEPDETNLMYPCWVVVAAGQPTEKRQATSMQDELGFVARVLLLDRRDFTDHSAIASYERWVYAADRAFDNQPLPGVAEAIRCISTVAPPGDPASRAYEHFQAGLVVKSVCWANRGLGV